MRFRQTMRTERDVIPRCLWLSPCRMVGGLSPQDVRTGGHQNTEDDNLAFLSD